MLAQDLRSIAEFTKDPRDETNQKAITHFLEIFTEWAKRGKTEITLYNNIHSTYDAWLIQTGPINYTEQIPGILVPDIHLILKELENRGFKLTFKESTFWRQSSLHASW